jgi:hypothetical protein
MIDWQGETELLGENLPQCHVVYHKSHMSRTGIEPGSPHGQPATNHLMVGTARDTLIWAIQKYRSESVS